ncbi:MAG TPA: hypothetical protein VFJ30_19035 [Phycisphaerae bacterium]|nr:hypothetical protein [Phycisphaerae bacterium]
MTQSDAPSQSPTPRKRSSNRHAKLVLLAAVLIVLAFFYVKSIRDPDMPKGFTTDLAAARQKARGEIRPMLILFWSPKVETTATGHLLGEKGLPHKSVVEAIEKGKYICVAVKLDRNLQSAPAKEFQITRVPTLLVLSSMGAERARLEGSVGHASIEAALVESAASKP